MLTLLIKRCLTTVKFYLKNRLGFTSICLLIIILIFIMSGIEDGALADELPSSVSAVPAYVMVNASDSATFSSETTATIQVVNVKEGDRVSYPLI